MKTIDMKQITVRPIVEDERERWNKLIAEHHYLHSRRLVGEQMRYIATYGDQWVALLGWTGASFKLAARDAWIGWSEAQRLERWRLIANNARLLILPGWNVRNLASRVLSLNMKRLSKDWVTTYSHPIVLAESFVDPSRFSGACYRASGFVSIGESKGFGLSAGNYYYHGQEKLILVRGLHNHAVEWLRAPFAHPKLMEGSPNPPLVDLNAMDLFGEYGLLARLSRLTEWRKAPGKIHAPHVIIGFVVCALLANVTSSFVQIHRWVDNLSEDTLRAFTCRRAYGAPSEPTIRRSMHGVNTEELCQIVAQWLSDQGYDRYTDLLLGRLADLHHRLMKPFLKPVRKGNYLVSQGLTFTSC